MVFLVRKRFGDHSSGLPVSWDFHRSLYFFYAFLLSRDVMAEDAQEAAFRAEAEGEEAEVVKRAVSKSPKRSAGKEDRDADKTRQWTEKYRARR